MTRAEQIRALLEEYAQQRARNQAALDARAARAEALDPQIAALRAENMSLAVRTMREILALPDQAARVAAAERMKAQGIANNAEIRRRLRAVGLPEDSLELKYRCAVCRDTGYVGEAPSRFCDCFEDRLREMRYADDDAPGVRRERFETYDEARIPEEGDQRRQLAAARDYCRMYADGYPNTFRRDLLLSGAGGLGKTFLLNCICNRVRDRGLSAVRITSFRMFEAMRRSHIGEAEGATDFDALLDAPLLLIDDLGAEPLMRNITIEYLFLLLSERGLRDRHTVITTNLTPVQLQERYGERVSSRLLNRDTTGIIKLTGKDLRQYRERKG